MENTPKQQLAISLFTGAVIALGILIGDIEKISLNKLLVCSIFIILIIISMKIILDPSTDVHTIGNIIKKILRIKKFSLNKTSTRIIH
ncbi:MAG: hypothetical protein KKF67_01165 [Nanoarchaeota archaeon]|nr:hypothetical protein [Nanoarchaeota archaeon]